MTPGRRRAAHRIAAVATPRTRQAADAFDPHADPRRQLAQSTGSARILAELGRLQTYLAPWGKLVEIAALNRLLNAMRGS